VFEHTERSRLLVMTPPSRRIRIDTSDFPSASLFPLVPQRRTRGRFRPWHPAAYPFVRLSRLIGSSELFADYCARAGFSRASACASFRCAVAAGGQVPRAHGSHGFAETGQLIKYGLSYPDAPSALLA
jgi:hypothetical protein